MPSETTSAQRAKMKPRGRSFNTETGRAASQRAHGVDRAIERLVDAAPTLTDEQLDRLAALLRGR